MTGAALPKPLNITSWIMQSVAAIVFLAMGAFPKLTADPYAVQLFEKVGLGEPGMYATGVAEFLAGVLILIPRTNWMGAALGALIMLGAMGSHLFTKLGMVPKFVNPQTQAVESNPLLFPFAMLLFGLCLGVVARRLHPASAPAPQTESEPPAEQD